MIKVGVIGAAGKMGNKILSVLKENDNILITSAVDAPNNSLKGQKIFNDTNLKYTDSVLTDIKNVDVYIDFSSVESTLLNLNILSEHKKPVVIGTTGFKEDEIKFIKDISKKIPIVLSPNMSIGVNVLFKLLENASKLLKEYDVELVELHHNKKKDSPSGTAIKIAEIISNSTDRKKEDWIYGRKGLVGERKQKEFGLHAVRLGDVIGEHTVYFCGNSERIELTHKAHTRDNFAKGAVKAALWLFGKKNGLYDMFDVLELK
jgi:4-hydroxy-tetrahydrodipicolinate reductase